MDAWINEPPAESSSESEEEPEQTNGPSVRSEFAGFGAPRTFGEESETKKKYVPPSPEEAKKVCWSITFAIYFINTALFD